MGRAALVSKLVNTLHLSVAERGELGESPHVDEVVAVIVEELEKVGTFGGSFWKPGQPCGDGTVLEALPDGRVRAQVQVATASMTPAHLHTREFSDARTAALFVIENDFAAGIDGVPVRR